MPADPNELLERWAAAGLLDAAAADRIRAFEAGRERRRGLRWPVWLALALGAILLAAGVMVFVATYWDDLSPASRLAVVLLFVAGFHLAGAWASGRFPAMAMALHGVGTVALGAGVFLVAQIFNLKAHWKGGLMIWALGASIGWALRRDWVQAMLAALLVPAWLAGEWIASAEGYRWNQRILAEGLCLLAATYLMGVTTTRPSSTRTALAWLGGLALIPCAAAVAVVGPGDPLPMSMAILGWSAALGLPLALAAALRREGVWVNLLAALWVLVLGALDDRNPLLYLWLAAGAVGLIASGLKESRRERVNLGLAAFGITVMVFYFDRLMDRLGQAVSLIGLGALFLGGGWLLERARRRLLGRLDEGAP